RPRLRRRRAGLLRQAQPALHRPLSAGGLRMSTPDPAQRTAEQVRDGMFANDRASKALGMQVTAIGPGRATLTMTVRADMLNGLDICHGGLVTTLADSAFAFACNSYNELTVASGFSVDLVAPAREGDVLTAVAEEVSLAGR